MQEYSKATALAQTGSARASNIQSAGRLIRCRGKSNAFLIAACVVRNRCAEVRDSNPSISRSRLRIGSCEFSAPFSRANDQTDGFLLRRSPEAPSCTMQARAFRCSPTRLAGCGAAASALLVCRVASERRCRDPRPHHQLHAIGTRVRVHSRRPSRPGASAAMAAVYDGEIGRDLRTELHGPGTHRLVAHIDAAARHNLFGIEQAECQAEAQPHCVMDDRRREPVTFAGNSSFRHLLEATITALHETCMRWPDSTQLVPSGFTRTRGRWFQGAECVYPLRGSI